ncbi:MAG: methyltransferase domain-containing protein [Theionarchaea archaeon]|nr:methyltransferase domain-containing protein [Theionarchaea archaeon]
MNEIEDTHEEIDWSKWYNFQGSMGIPIIHLGGARATEDLLALCNITEESEVLDIGCGTGYTACKIAQKYNSHVVGIDISEDMIVKAQERAQQHHLKSIELHIADVFDLPFQNETFDAVIMESVLNLLPDEKREALVEIVRVLKPGGVLGANEDFIYPETPDKVLNHLTAVLPIKTFFTPQELRQLFEDSGLEVVHCKENPSRGVITPKEIVNIIRTMGLVRFLSYSVRSMVDPDIRRIARYYREGSNIMIKYKETRDFFGYALIIGRKMHDTKIY